MLDVKQLIKLFPFVNMIFANNNKIEKLILPETLPAEFALLLQKNKIKELPLFKLGEGCYVDLRNNPLSNAAKENAQCAIRTHFMQANRPLINTLSSSDAFKKGARTFFGFSLPIFCGTAALFDLGYVTWKYFKGSTEPVMSMLKNELKEDLKSPIIVTSAAISTLAAAGLLWYGDYFKPTYAGERLWNSYGTPLIDFDQVEEK